MLLLNDYRDGHLAGVQEPILRGWTTRGGDEEMRLYHCPCYLGIDRSSPWEWPEIVSNFRSEEHFIRKRLKTYYPTHLLGRLEC